MARLEHVNVTVTDPDATAAVLCDLFDWRLRWAGAAKNGGRSVHVGENDTYLALYSPGQPLQAAVNSYLSLGGMNHIGVVVDNLDATERRVIAAGFTPHSHADYEPGRRFYFHDGNGVEIEVVSYEKA
jgi:catechol 2,3-dioxygenase-like lactoylglutathione lyase family enzyme